MARHVRILEAATVMARGGRATMPHLLIVHPEVEHVRCPRRAST